MKTFFVLNCNSNMFIVLFRENGKCDAEMMIHTNCSHSQNVKYSTLALLKSPSQLAVGLVGWLGHIWDFNLGVGVHVPSLTKSQD